MRGRNRSKGPNPLTRSYESNGPDVKVRGTAQHVADKYAQLARDAQASGDPVAAENYHQHAEHDYRLIAAAQEQFRQQYGAVQRPFDDDEDGDDDGQGFGYGANDRNGQAPDEFGEAGYGQPSFGNDERGGREQRYDRGPNDRNRQNGDRGQQQRFDRNGPDRNYPERGQGERFDRNAERGGDRRERYSNNRNNPENGRQDLSRNDRGERQDRGDRQDRNERGDRPDRADRSERFDRNPRPERSERSERQPRPDAPRPAAVADDESVSAALPAFLTAPPRPVAAVAEEAPRGEATTPDLPGIVAGSEDGEARPKRRTRVRRVAEPAPEVEKAVE